MVLPSPLSFLADAIGFLARTGRLPRVLCLRMSRASRCRKETLCNRLITPLYIMLDHVPEQLQEAAMGLERTVLPAWHDAWFTLPLAKSGTVYSTAGNPQCFSP